MMMCPPFSFFLIIVHHNHFGSTLAICSFIMFCSFLFFPPQRPGAISAAAFSDANNDFRAKKKLDLVVGTTPSFLFSVHIYV